MVIMVLVMSMMVKRSRLSCLQRLPLCSVSAPPAGGEGPTLFIIAIITITIIIVIIIAIITIIIIIIIIIIICFLILWKQAMISGLSLRG